MFTLTITEHREGLPDIERQVHRIDEVSDAQLLKVTALLHQKPRKPRSDKGTKREGSLL